MRLRHESSTEHGGRSQERQVATPEPWKQVVPRNEFVVRHLVYQSHGIRCHNRLTSFRDKISAHQVLQSHGRYLNGKIRRILSPKLKGELRQIVNLGHKKGNKEVIAEHEVGEVDIFRQLDDLPLEVLSDYVDTEVRALNSARSDLSYQRSKGAHKVSGKAGSFVMEFDRFLKAYSGVVDVLTSVDAQYGGVASTTLSLLFAVSFFGSKYYMDYALD